MERICKFYYKKHSFTYEIFKNNAWMPIFAFYVQKTHMVELALKNVLLHPFSLSLVSFYLVLVDSTD